MSPFTPFYSAAGAAVIRAGSSTSFFSGFPPALPPGDRFAPWWHVAQHRPAGGQFGIAHDQDLRGAEPVGALHLRLEAFVAVLHLHWSPAAARAAVQWKAGILAASPRAAIYRAGPDGGSAICVATISTSRSKPMAKPMAGVGGPPRASTRPS
jgi:hypothetical protein